MTDRVSAVIIPFPTRVQPVVEAVAEPTDRLGVALQGLALALAEQKDAVQKWRDALNDLNGSMRDLSDNLQRVDIPAPQAS